ncbi:ABC transporter substrate-binding protein [Myroides odoratimimus]|uniref:ABC transporter substrate-binding protein n=1 Tax=Myroides odoratimimus TaxID=76832 RepID=UPI00103A5668|nr:ABC transporter substrate-binding protein [Myroides odoratimimus]MDM1059074.1 ABC transporter substrate-binding protein [Myroides odoratimimus]MDM1093519.1 ABC transporter substrate-binding protein [Myroides odoratimimus]MDM1327591.1 ABC transporter substrate-binding protein [Myroides odoratimimus]MDM1400928.1 ABC transporter substrate-binding protein [Myroides odoratimimus]MDM1411153.1 ABC transporter substrate-binding protein [Myroides odoratimimus]
MKNWKIYSILFLVTTVFVSCKKESNTVITSDDTNTIEYAKGFTIEAYDQYSVVNVKQAWVGADKSFKYVLYKEGKEVIPDSLRTLPSLKVPVQSIVVTSTTHLPSLVVLEEEKSLKGFPGLNYVSSPSIRKLINDSQIKEVGQNEQLNTELLLDLNPSVIVAFAMDGSNQALQLIEKSGIPVVYNGDWVEQTPLGKAEWIKLFGALYGKEKEAKIFFDKIVQDYKEAQALVKDAKNNPTVMSGAMYQDVWYTPQGQSWMAIYFKDAKSDYLWKETEGTGSLSLSLEVVLDKAIDASFWINPAQYETLQQLVDANPHYAKFNAFKNKNVYSFSPRKGETGGSLFYELGPTRPDLVLKDLIYILHPEISIPNYQPVFFEQLK